MKEVFVCKVIIIGLPVDKWRKYVNGVANPRTEDG